MTRIVDRVRAGVLVTGIVAGLLAVGATPAEAAARVGVRNDRGTAMADDTYRTQLTITGRGFQVVKGGFGGVYLAFGWVDDPSGGTWKPSRGGVTGDDYRYVPDSESTGNQGYLKFIAFPDSSTAAEAQATLTTAGRFTISLTVPGPTFRSVDRNGTAHDVDCRRVTCGVITIGAHGVQNTNNETFTPVPFGTVYSARASARPSATAPARAPQPTAAPTTASTAAPAATAPPAATTPRVTADRRTARAGNVLTFTGGGFSPGEGVVGVLDDGVTGFGPAVAGPAGDVAGVLRLPSDLEPGTHELRLTGAVSGAEARDRFPVLAATANPQRTVPVAEASSGIAASRLFLLAAAVLLAAVIGTMGGRTLLRRHRRGQESAS